jgi:phosphatidylglycerol---prolipoprotein diacylglyceryl transferase
MSFPFYLHLGPLLIHPHFVLEALAYFVGYRVYLKQRNHAGDHLSASHRMWIVAAAIAGAAVGSKLLYWVGDPALTVQRWNDLFYLMAGKTIVGGLIGGLIGVEWTKRRLGIVRRTGDLFAIPLCIGIAIGRIGCFLSGLSDDTYGVEAGSPWGIDFGDGIKRHPVQLYEIVWLCVLAIWLGWLARKPHREGDLFKGFMVGYFGFRLAIDFLKPGVTFAGLTSIQWACVIMLLYYCRDLPHLFARKEPVKQ